MSGASPPRLLLYTAPRSGPWEGVLYILLHKDIIHVVIHRDIIHVVIHKDIIHVVIQGTVHSPVVGMQGPGCGVIDMLQCDCHRLTHPILID